MTELVTVREIYGKTLAKLGKINRQIVVLDADISKSTCTYYFTREFPDRAYNFGVAEQNMMAIAAGMSTCGKIPFVSTYAVFATMRACEQVRTMIAYPKLNVKIVVTHGGISTGWDGVTHQGTEDIAMMRAIPNLTVISPADGVSTAKIIELAVEHQGPMYIRLTRNPCPLVYSPDEKFVIGKAKLVKRGTDVTIIATGIMIVESLKAAEILNKRGISVRIIDMHTIKPIDKDIILRAAKETGVIVTAEDHNIIGGLGSAVAEVVSENFPVPIARIGLKDTFGESGAPDELFVKYGLSYKHIATQVLKILKKKT